MGQKINPHVLRLGVLYTWQSRWFNHRDYKKVLLEDYKLRTALMEKLRYAGISSVEIERSIKSMKIVLYVLRPGMVIGRGGTGLEDIKKFVTGIMLSCNKTLSIKQLPKTDIRVEPIKDPNLDAYLVGKNISEQLIKRMPYKRILVQTADRVMNAGAKGVRIVLAGRIAGAEIHRREKIQLGKVPLSTIREHIVYACVPALTKKGYIGVKVWINREEKGDM